MLSRDSWNVCDLGRQLDLTEVDVRAALAQLAELNLLTVVPCEDEDPAGKHPTAVPVSAFPLPPQVGLQPLLLRQAELRREQGVDLVERCCQAAAPRPSILDEYAGLTAALPQKYAEQVLGGPAVQERIELLAGEATSECLIFNPGGTQMTSSLEANKSLDQAALSRGVSVRIIYAESLGGDPRMAGHARWLNDIGGQVRTTGSLPVRMLLIDRRVALIPIDPVHASDGVVQLTGTEVVAGLTALFERVWVEATPLDACPDPGEVGPSPQERQLLRLLADGFTDAAASSRLGLSLRTVRRMMADITTRLDARGRFAVGVQSVKRGWI